MPNEQTNSQRRFTVIELPVLPIVKESLLLPFKYLPELVKFGKMPFMLILAVDVILLWARASGCIESLTGSLMVIAHFILFTPFAVAWTKLAIRGRQAVAQHPAFAYSRTQLMYLLATAVMIVAFTICVGIPFVLVRYFQRNFENQLMLLAGGGFFAGTLCLSGRIPPARICFSRDCSWQVRGHLRRLETDRGKYRTTRGNCRPFVPSLLAHSAGVRMVYGLSPARRCRDVRGIIDMLLVAMATTALAGTALAYKTLVLDQPQDEVATPAIRSTP